MSIAVGTQLGSHEITALLGKGGMGEVYRARDSKLKRDVAIKILPNEFSRDADRVSRFQREAEVLASLNHPNIAAIYDVNEANGSRYLVLELVEGETLAERLRRGPITAAEALPIARQIAEALEAAHEKGIVHRDLKPANIKITAAGKVKVLDFGLAKIRGASGEPSQLSQSPTLMTAAAGVIMGTAAYMSPQQARGHEADHIADVWAFGCVLYETLTARQAFDGETVTDILARVLTSDPDWTALPESTPPRIRQILKRCLQKDPRRRLHDISDVRIELEEALEPREQDNAVVVPASRGRFRVAWIAIAVAGIVVGAIGSALYFHRTPDELPELRLEVTTPPTDDLLSIALSPDGHKLVFVARSGVYPRALWLRSLDSTATQPLIGTDGASFPFWSPDSRSVGFFANGKLKRIDIAGGAVQPLANAPAGRGGTWNKDGVIVFAPEPGGPVYRTSATGGTITPATHVEVPKQTNHRAPQFLPDGRHFLFYARGDSEGRGVYVGALGSLESRRLCDADAAGIYAPTGDIFFIRQGTLFGQRFDIAKLELLGDPRAVARDVAFDDVLSMGAISASVAGIAYRSQSAAAKRQLTWFDRSGKSLGTVGEPDAAALWNPDLSSDGKRVAVDRTVNSNRDVWIMDVARSILTRLTSGPASEGSPVWSPDGTRIGFFSNRKGNNNMYEKPANGTGADVPLLESPQNKNVLDWSADGRFILFTISSPTTGRDLWVLPLFGDRKLFPLADSNFEEDQGQFSPDGRWVVYQSNESGSPEIYVQPAMTGGAKSRISTNGGVQARWPKDSKELFYISSDAKLMAVPISFSSGAPAIEAGKPIALFAPPIAGGPMSNGGKQQYAVSSDGKRFLINITIEEQATTPITLLLNWKPKQ